jgi:hypothetical protein
MIEQGGADIFGGAKASNQALILAAMPEINANRSMMISTAFDKFRDDFLTYDTENKWTEQQLGEGMAITVDGIANGARYLNINSGIVDQSETILLSKMSFKSPFRVAAGISLSQRIVNQQFFFEIVEVDDNGNVVTLSDPFTAPEAKDARNWAAFYWDGVTTANARTGVRAQGISPELIANQSFGTTSSVATGTTPNFIQRYNFEIVCTNEYIVFQANAINSTTAGTSVKRTSIVPNPERSYAIRIRVKNTGVPASTTDMRIHMVRVLDASRVSVDFGIVGGRVDAQNAAPVALSSQAVTVASTTLLPSATVGGTVLTHHRIATADTNLVNVKNAAGSIASIEISNLDTVPIFFKLYNKASAPVLATDTPIKTIMVPAGQTILFNKSYYDRLATGISFAMTKGVEINDTTALTANLAVVNISYI